MRIQIFLLSVGFSFFSLLSFSQDSVQVNKNVSNLLQRTNFAPIPIFSYNRSYGISVGGMLNAFTDITANDTISPPSMTVLGLGYTQNKSYFGILFQKLFLKEDTWRIVWKLGLGRTNFQFYQEDEDLGGNGVFISGLEKYFKYNSGISANDVEIS
ncbi:MAG: hypothetical protein ACRC2O_04965 [Chitinophagaceae bacterium]